MLAQVFITSGTTPVPDTAAMQKIAEEAAVNQRAVDGCEGIYILTDPSSGDGLAFVLWRDEGAMKASADHQVKEIAAAKEATPPGATMNVSTPKVYEVSASA